MIDLLSLRIAYARTYENKVKQALAIPAPTQSMSEANRLKIGSSPNLSFGNAQTPTRNRPSIEAPEM